MTKASKRFYSLLVNGTTADLDIYGDICGECAWGDESDMGVFKLSRELENLHGVSVLNVNINSYGGEVAEGIAIYNALRRFDGKVVTRCDGMACSIASVIFMAGEERIMYASSMLMIHNASSMCWGTAADMRKAADDVEKITTMSKAAYMEHLTISEKELSDLMDAETWISPAEALNWGFATAIETREEANPTQSARGSLMELVTLALEARAAQVADPEEDDPEEIDEQLEAAPEQGGDPDPDPEDGEEDDPDPDEGEEDDPDADPEKDDEDEKSEQKSRSFFMAAFK